MIALRLPAVSFGAVSAIVTSVGLIIGFGAAEISKPTIIAGLLIVGLADNLTDSLSIHIYQESEKLEEHAAFRATLCNFVTRVFVSMSFVLLVLTLSGAAVIMASLAWGILLLVSLTWLVARGRHANVPTEILKHLVVAAVVVAVSHAIGMLIRTYMP
ncbi:MAG: hypothetical protein WCF20_07285 [Methylovirgula sp.]